MDNKQRLKCFAFLGCGSLHGEHAGSSLPVIYLQSEVEVLHADCSCPCSSFNEIDVQQMYVPTWILKRYGGAVALYHV